MQTVPFTNNLRMVSVSDQLTNASFFINQYFRKQGIHWIFFHQQCAEQLFIFIYLFNVYIYVEDFTENRVKKILFFPHDLPTNGKDKDMQTAHDDPAKWYCQEVKMFSENFAI